MVLAFCLGGCAETGDLGRPKPTFWRESVAPLAGWGAATLRNEPASLAMLTDDERELRDRAYRFLMPARERTFFDRELAALAMSRITPASVATTDVAAYFQALVIADDRSPRARYQRLREDMESDRQLLTPFGATACRVAEMDRVRMKTLEVMSAPPGSGTTDDMARAAAVARVAENETLVRWVEAALQARLAQYRYALEHLVVTSPDRDAVRSERVLEAFEVHPGLLVRCSQARGNVTVTPGAGGARFLPRTEPELPPK